MRGGAPRSSRSSTVTVRSSHRAPALTRNTPNTISSVITPSQNRQSQDGSSEPGSAPSAMPPLIAMQNTEPISPTGSQVWC